MPASLRPPTLRPFPNKIWHVKRVESSATRGAWHRHTGGWASPQRPGLDYKSLLRRDLCATRTTGGNAGFGESDATSQQPEEAPIGWTAGSITITQIIRVRCLPVLISLVVLGTAVAKFFAGKVAPLPRVPWGLGMTLSTTLVGTVLLLFMLPNATNEAGEPIFDGPQAGEAATDAMHTICTVLALGLVYPLALARGMLLVPLSILERLDLSSMVVTLLQWAVVKPAGLFPLHWFPVGSWVWAVASGAVILASLDMLFHVVFSLRSTPRIEVVPGGSATLSTPLTVNCPGGNTLAAPSVHSAPLVRRPWVRAVLLAPFWEEVLFRGLLLPSLASYMPLWVAVVLSSVWFMFGHPGEGWLYVFLGGVIMSTAYCRTGNLVPAMVLHCLHNLYQYSWFRQQALNWVVWVEQYAVMPVEGKEESTSSASPYTLQEGLLR